MRPSRIFEYLGDSDPVLEARKKTRCGQSTTGQDPVEVGEIPEEISDPVVIITPPANGYVREVDCEVLTANTAVAVAVVYYPGSPDRELLIGTFMTVDPIDSVTVTLDMDQLIDDTITNWRGNNVTRNISVTRLNDTKFVVFCKRQGGTNDTLYAIVCTVSGTTITPTTPQLLSDVSLRSSLGSISSISPMFTEDKTILCYYDLDVFSGGVYGGSARVITFTGTAVDTVGTKLTTHANGRELDIDQIYDLDDPDKFVVVGRNASVHAVVTKVRISGTTLTAEGDSANLGMYTGSSITALTNVGSYSIAMNQNITTGSELVSASYPGGIVTDSELTADADDHGGNRIDLESVGGQGGNPDRVFALYCSDTDAGDGGTVAMEIFTLGSGVFTPLKTHAIDTFAARSMRIAQYGFSATKAPFVYVSNVDPNPATVVGSVAKAVIYEAGTG